MKRLLIAAASMVLVSSLAACQPETGKEPIAFGTFEAPSAPTTPSATPTPASVPDEFVPEPPPSPVPPQSTCKQGPFQADVEKALVKMGGFGEIITDGFQSDQDCAAIKKFQKRFGLRPDDGVAGPQTNSVTKRLLATNPANCQAGPELTACIDLTNQTTYVMENGKVVYGPTVTRTGYNHPDGKGGPTPTGTFKIKERLNKNWTESFKVYLYYWQRIMDNNGFHETTSNIHDFSLGSHGCVNLLHEDAVAYWNTLKMGTTVKVFGRRPGT